MRSALIKVLNTHYWIPLLGPVEALAGLILLCNGVAPSLLRMLSMFLLLARRSCVLERHHIALDLSLLCRPWQQGRLTGCCVCVRLLFLLLSCLSARV